MQLLFTKIESQVNSLFILQPLQSILNNDILVFFINSAAQEFGTQVLTLIKYLALLKQLEGKTQKTEELEKSTTQLDEEAKQLHKQFTQNREICAR